jgi:hypothetical protein
MRSLVRVTTRGSRAPEGSRSLRPTSVGGRATAGPSKGEYMRLVRPVLAAAVAATTLFAGAAPAWAVPPPNDDFDSATVVTEPLPFTDSVSTVEATTAPDDPFCAGNGHTVWYTYTPSAGGFVNANTFGSDYDTTLSAYTGARGALTQIACNDDAGGNLQSSVTWEVVAGTTYHLMAGSFGDAPGGNLSLTVQESEPPPPLPTVDVTIDPIGHMDPRTGVAHLSGTFTCTDADFLEAFGDLRQPVGRFTIFGFFEFFADGSSCDGTPHPWAVDVSGENGNFAGGRATARVDAFACGPGECASDFEERTIRLRR